MISLEDNLENSQEIQKKVTMFSLPDRQTLKPRMTILIINHTVFAISFKILFEIYWNKGMTLDEYQTKVLFEEELESIILQQC